MNQIIESDELRKQSKLVLGGGSNILFTKDFDGLVMKNNIRGIEITAETEHYVDIKVGAGENWHAFVTSCVQQNLGGLENLSLIPGNVGASPMQNIGAYGVEVKDLVQKVDFIDLKSGEMQSLNADQCEFGYRTSIFKTAFKGLKFITHVHYRLQKSPRLNTSYGAIEEELHRLGLEASVANVSQAVINIRRSKLPDPKEIGNAGSFFKNPVIPRNQAEALKEKYPDMPVYPSGEGFMKIAAGWLIEKSGWKGKTIDSYGVHKKQALVLVNYGGATGNQINQLSENIRKSISDQFGILLEKEVNIL